MTEKYQLIINGEKKSALKFQSILSAKIQAEALEGEKLFWMNDKAYGKYFSYRILPIYPKKTINE